jgi:hypothetical protein
MIAHPKRWVAIASALVVLAVTNMAAACPVCATRQDGGTLGWVALGAFVISPWIIALSVGLWIRNNARRSMELPPTESE